MSDAWFGFIVCSGIVGLPIALWALARAIHRSLNPDGRSRITVKQAMQNRREEREYKEVEAKLLDETARQREKLAAEAMQAEVDRKCRWLMKQHGLDEKVARHAASRAPEYMTLVVQHRCLPDCQVTCKKCWKSFPIWGWSKHYGDDDRDTGSDYVTCACGEHVWKVGGIVSPP